MNKNNKESLSVGLVGLGAIGATVLEALDKGVPNLKLTALTSRDMEKARRLAGALASPVQVLTLQELCAAVDVVVDCAAAEAFSAVGTASSAAGKVLVTVNAAPLLDHLDIVATAEKAGGRVIVASGALLGMDGVRAVSEGNVRTVSIKTRKPPASLKKAKYVVENGINLEQLREPLLLLSGFAREAARNFPANANVAAALALAGVGPDQTQVEIWADPGVERNTHTITVDAEASRFSITVEGVPSPTNPATGLLTPLSVISCLRGLVSSVRVGS